jgi:hypothetical protein
MTTMRAKKGHLSRFCPFSSELTGNKREEWAGFEVVRH